VAGNKPQGNAYIERHNRIIRYSGMSKHLFETLEEVQDYVTKWLWFYNHEKPHKTNDWQATTNGGLTSIFNFG